MVNKKIQVSFLSQKTANLFSSAEMKKIELAGVLGLASDFKVKNDEITRIVAAENTDRAEIWEFYAAVSGDDPEESLPSVRENFAEIMVKSSPSGTWVEDREGNWVRK